MTPFVLVSGDFVTTGGMDRANYALASYLARRGHKVRLVAHRVADDLRELPNVVWRRVRKPADSYLLGSPILDWAGRRWARGAARDGGRVVVNGGNCRFDDVNWVHYVHAAFRPQPAGPLHRRFRYRLQYLINLRQEARALRGARLVLANSELTARHLRERLGLDPARVRRVYYGTDAATFRPPTPDEKTALRGALGLRAESPAIIFVGGLGDRRKGFDTLFEAWRLLVAARDWDAILLVVGRGRELPRWQERATSLGLDRSIRFLGFRRDVPDLLRACDALVAPTRYEAYGLGVQEALCCGLPAFVSATAGVAEQYPAALGDLLLPDPEDAADLAARLRRWRADLTAWPARVAPVSAALRSWTWDHMAEQMIALIESN